MKKALQYTFRNVEHEAQRPVLSRGSIPINFLESRWCDEWRESRIQGLASVSKSTPLHRWRAPSKWNFSACWASFSYQMQGIDKTTQSSLWWCMFYSKLAQWGEGAMARNYILLEITKADLLIFFNHAFVLLAAFFVLTPVNLGSSCMYFMLMNRLHTSGICKCR